MKKIPAYPRRGSRNGCSRVISTLCALSLSLVVLGFNWLQEVTTTPSRSGLWMCLVYRHQSRSTAFHIPIWRNEVDMLRPPSDVEPIATYRGHTAPVTSVLISSPLKLVFSASLDSSIRIWILPEPSRDPYGPYDPATSVQTLVGHTEAIWDLRLLPSRASFAAPKAAKDPYPRLASCSADGSVRIWARNGTSGHWTLESTINDFPKGVVPTCLGVYHSDYSKVLVGLSSGLIGLYDVETRRQVATIGCGFMSLAEYQRIRD